MVDDKNRNLLFAVLAVQLKGVSPERAMEAAAAWLVNPATPLSSYLEELGILPAADIKLLGTLVDEILKSFEGNAEEALKSLPGGTELSLTLIGRAVPGPHQDTRPMADLPEGMRVLSAAALEELPGRYSQLSEYGRGGQGRVLLVHDELFGREIALKELLIPHDPDHVGPDPSPMGEASGVLGRFLQEARITGQLEHPAIVPVYEIGRRLNGTFYYTMKLMRGKTLARAIRDCKSLEERLRILPSILDLCQALAYAHSRRVIHRDIKPANAMIGEFGETVLLDWGLAKIQGTKDVYSDKLRETLRSLKVKEPDKTPRTQAGEALGTPHYMPPEQARGEIDNLDERSDVYSMGAMLYETLTGKAPFDGDTARAIIHQVLNREPKPIEVLSPGTPPELIAICRKAMAKRPEERYQTMLELRDDLVRFQTGAFVQSYRYNSREAIALYYRQHRVRLNAAAAALAVVIAVGIWSYVSIWQARELEKQQREAAEVAKGEAETARGQAEVARGDAEENAYLARLQLAQQQISERNFLLARANLWNTPPNLRGPEWSLLISIAYPDNYTIEFQDSEIFNAKLSPNGELIATAEFPGPSRIYRARTGEEIVRFTQSTELPTAISWNPIDPQLAIGDTNGGLWLWSAETGELQYRIDAHHGLISSTEFNPAGTELATMGNDGALRIWSTTTGAMLLESTVRSKGGSAIYNPDGLTLAVTSTPDTIAVHSREDMASLYQIRGFAPYYSPDGQFIAALLPPSLVTIFDSATGNSISQLPAFEGDVYDLEFSPDTSLLTIASSQRNPSIWNVASNEFLDTPVIAGHVYESTFVDGKLLVNFTEPNTIQLWNLATDALVYDVAAHGTFGHTLNSNQNGLVASTASHHKTLQVWDVLHPPGRDILTLPRTKSETTYVSPSGRLIANFCGGDGNYLSQRNRPESALRFDASSLAKRTAIAIDGNDETMLTAHDAFTAILWDLYNGTPTVRWARAHENGSILDVELSHHGSLAATAGWDGTIRLWDSRGGDQVRVLAGGNSPVCCLSFSADDGRLAAAYEDGLVRIWNVSTAEELVMFDDSNCRVEALTFSSNGALLAAGNSDGRILLWDTRSLDLLRHFSASDASVSGIEFISDNRLLSVAGHESTWWSTTLQEPLVKMKKEVSAFRNGEFFLKERESATTMAWTSPESPEGSNRIEYEQSRSRTPPGALLVPVIVDTYVAIQNRDLASRLLAVANEFESQKTLALSQLLPFTRWKLCLLDDGSVSAVNGNPTTDALTFKHIVESLPGTLQSSELEPVVVKVQQNGLQSNYNFIPLSLQQGEKSIPLPANEILEIHEWLLNLLSTQYSHYSSLAPAIRESCIELRPMGLFTRERMLRYGLGSLQQLIAIDGLPLQCDAAGRQRILESKEAFTHKKNTLSLTVLSGDLMETVCTYAAT